MKKSDFFKQLQSELPVWINKGWVQPSKQQDILDYVAEQVQTQGRTSTTTVFITLGIILFATGVITFFAANWGYIPKLFKLILLFSGMWSAYALAYMGYQSQKENLAKFSTEFLLLGVLLFGSNIWLIAQIYHIEAYYPNGVLVWSLGALLAALLLRDTATLALSIILGFIWTYLEYYTLRFNGGIHWAFLILWVVQTFCLLFFQKNRLFNLAMLNLTLWSILSLSSSFYISVYLFELYFLLVCLLFFIGVHATFLSKIHPSLNLYKTPARSLKHWGIFLAFCTLYLLSVPELLRLPWETSRSVSDFYPSPYSIGFGPMVFIVLFNLGYLLGIFFQYKSKHLFTPETYPETYQYRLSLYFGFVLYLVLNVLLLFTVYVGFAYIKENSSFISLFFNIIFFIGTLWIIQLGTQTKNSFYINLGCFFFALGLISRYFDTFWSLLNRSFFFMIGGVLLIALAYVIEKNRRRFIKKIQQ